MNINEMISKNMEYRNHMIRKAKPIVDLDVINAIKNIEYVNINSDLPISANQFEFLDTHLKWISSSKNYKITGLDKFTPLVTSGVTDAFNDFYFLNKKISVMRGEYTYHRDLGYEVLDNIHTIEPYSSLIISYPFSATGNVHPDWEKIMEVCDDKKIKVFVDCCLFGVSKVEELDLSLECITHVAFSFSKIFSTAGNRTGVLYTRYNETTPLQKQSEHFYTNMMGQIMHLHLMNNFEPDYIFNKYRSKQEKLCKEYDLDISDTVMFGTSTSSKFDYFERDKYINRICLAYSLQEFSIPLEF